MTDQTDKMRAAFEAWTEGWWFRNEGDTDAESAAWNAWQAACEWQASRTDADAVPVAAIDRRTLEGFANPLNAHATIPCQLRKPEHAYASDAMLYTAPPVAAPVDVTDADVGRADKPTDGQWIVVTPTRRPWARWLARYDAEDDTFSSDGGWFEKDEVLSWRALDNKHWEATFDAPPVAEPVEEHWLRLLSVAKKVPHYTNVPGSTTGTQLDEAIERVEEALAQRGREKK